MIQSGGSRREPCSAGRQPDGINFFAGELAAKRLELLRELYLLPLSAVLVNPAMLDTESTLREMQRAARAIGLQVQVGQRQHRPRDRWSVCICPRAT